MEIHKATYADMDWSKYDQLKQALFELDINCQKWSTGQCSMVEVDVTSEDALSVLLRLKIINEGLYDELMLGVQTLFLS